MIKRLAASALLLSGLTGMQAPPAAPLSLTRLDCGDFLIQKVSSYFSDTFQYPDVPRKIVGSCYLIRHGDRYMLWDTGLAESLIGKPYVSPAQTVSLKRSVVDQLAQLGVKPERIEFVGISHWHFDHVSQAARFPQAKLLIGKGDADFLRAVPSPDKDSTEALKHWLSGPGQMEATTKDLDVFKDGRVVMLTTPGHTPGHNALLVRLASGPVLLTGDLYHFTEQVENKGVPPFNHNRADTLASMDRFDRIVKNLGAKVIIQHEPADVAKLPAFPKAAQ